MPALVPHPPIEFDAGGAPLSTLYGDVFRSRSGAWAEAREVFVEGCELARRWGERTGRPASFTVLELGFGLGVNFLATLQAWRESAPPGLRLHYVSIEAHPLSAADLRHALGVLEAPPADAGQLAAQWPRPLPGLHRLAFVDGAVTLTLCLGEAQALLPRLRLGADAFFLDGFAPARNPAMWQPPLMRALARLARPEATLATWSAAGAVRDALAEAGFAVERLAGHGGKRHRLRARYAPRWRSFEPPAPPPSRPSRSALVVGAGLAGAAVAAGFARRGWQVTVLEAGKTVASGGSAQPLCADHLHLSSDDNVLARLTRAALAFAARDGSRSGSPIGKLAVDRDEANTARRRAMIERLGFPEGFVRHVSAQEAGEIAGIAVPHAALWLPDCDACDPRAAIGAWLEHPAIELRTASQVHALRRDDGHWSALDAGGAPLAHAAVAVLANAGDAVRLGGLRSFPIRAMRGQSTWLARECVGPLRTSLSGGAWAVPAGERILIGASFDDDARMILSRAADLGNLDRLARMIGGDPQRWIAHARFASLGLRVATTDRLPAIGELPDEAAVAANAEALARNERIALPRADGLYGAFAFGSRGLLWASLAGALLPAMAEGEPMPLEADLLRTIDPARFVRRRLRQRDGRT
ncbi:MAG: FAD-dependent 5-carboxymethylaminomethyl-2-thiouridine(34) oxidoreductase MnmC [Burkholderiales bacterium]|nr:FAD-dependent 5-carboxymethylaminomethyl-2-thiouridine(34) oxidoreductase MnmC [Burkholderiales bacterium]OJX06683.1 MAG: hypothetical protein BGO72_16975 [Burkholderiales bacterium 70-64]